MLDNVDLYVSLNSLMDEFIISTIGYNVNTKCLIYNDTKCC